MGRGNVRVKGYFRHNEATYRVQVWDSDEIWIEREGAYGGNIPMGDNVDDIMYGLETWKLDAIPALLDKYDELYNREE